ncbi:MAG: endonuclease III [Anaerolineae bacterium]|nr:endonuclease III [Caldilineales bacterium]MCX7853861.1 endonuclease III [Caldilineales bacterium]MDW8270736.1 endonuclease III [Anaerolineae bacterium]
MTAPDTELAAAIAAVHHRLAAAYGLPIRQPHHEDPVAGLILTILSQNTNDRNADRAFAALRAAYPDWQAVMRAPTAELAAVIRSAGLAAQKAPRIQKLLRRLYEEQGHFDLSHLAALPVGEARRWLTRFEGVGHKTASVLLLFAFGQPAFPVDTHVHRVTRRLGLAPEQATPDRVMALVEAHAPPDWFYPLHLNLIRHGRQVCQARRPRCEACVLTDLCAFYRRRERETARPTAP